MFIRLVLVFLLVLGLSGCATTKAKAKKMSQQQIEARISDLEIQMQNKDEEINDLRMELAKFKSVSKVVIKEEAPLKFTAQQIQIALKNAGYYEGAIDGKIGPKTIKAIKDFQAAVGLNADGKVGRKTWAVLSKYLQE